MTKADFIVNSEKSVWQPIKALTWLKIEVDLNNDALKISSERIDRTKFIIGNIVQLKTRALYKVIEKRLSGDKKFNIGNYNDTVEEISY